MLTVKDIQEVRFTKTMGGYKTAEVDAFLDQCADTVEALLAQNEENTNKMQVLAETIVDYRNQEDSIRTALISAQRMADSVVAEAKEKAEAIIAEAQEKAQAVTAQADETAELAREKALLDIEAEDKELRRIRQEVADFKSRLLSAYREHLTLIGVLEDAQPEEAVAPVAEEPVVTEDAAPTEAAVSEEPVPAYTGPIPDFSVFELKEEE